MNKVERLADMIGHRGRTLLAHWAEVSPSMVTRWIKRGRVDPAYNIRIKRGLYSHASTLSALEQADWIDRAAACLEDGVCPTCGRPIDDHRVL